MKRLLFALALSALLSDAALAQAAATSPAPAAPRPTAARPAVTYGANAAVGRALIKEMIAGVPASQRETTVFRRGLKVTGMMLEGPNIDPKTLQKITAPTLVIAGNHDVITDEHTLEIFHNLPNSQLAILPDSTHAVPYDNPALFDATVERFPRKPFVRRDRTKDMMGSLQKVAAEKAAAEK